MEIEHETLCKLLTLVALVLRGVAGIHAGASLPQPGSVFLEELTWIEVRDAIAGGKTTVIIPTGGTEQNGPHIVLGKHNYLVKYKAGEIARQLGNALVAPVVAYVPEGDVDPPTGHMRYAGTITTPQDVFVKVLEFAARSFKQHGFVDVVLVGDSGGNQEGQRLVAAALNKEWAATPVRVHHITAYYPGRGDDWVVSQGVSAADVGTHAGTHDTASLMYINPSMLRFDKMVVGKQATARVMSATRRKRRRCSASVFSRCRLRMPRRRFASFESAAAGLSPAVLASRISMLSGLMSAGVRFIAACVAVARRLRRKVRPSLTPRARVGALAHFVAAEVIAEVKDFAVALGGHATGIFCGRRIDCISDNRCYFTGKLQLPEFYSTLRMVREDEERCTARSGEHDVFFYPVQAVASGEETITVSLAEASTERLLVVVPHEDFHNQREARKAPTEVAEAAATLVGFLTASEFAKDRFGEESAAARTLARDADLFLRKSFLVNRVLRESQRPVSRFRFRRAHAGADARAKGGAVRRAAAFLRGDRAGTGVVQQVPGRDEQRRPRVRSHVHAALSDASRSLYTARQRHGGARVDAEAPDDELAALPRTRPISLTDNKRNPMVLTKSELLTALQNEARILLHLIGKIDRTAIDYRPSPKQRSSSTCCDISA